MNAKLRPHCVAPLWCVLGVFALSLDGGSYRNSSPVHLSERLQNKGNKVDCIRAHVASELLRGVCGAQGSK